MVYWTSSVPRAGTSSSKFQFPSSPKFLKLHRSKVLHGQSLIRKFSVPIVEPKGNIALTNEPNAMLSKLETSLNKLPPKG